VFMKKTLGTRFPHGPGSDDNNVLAQRIRMD